jgi:hypothetical protein
MKMGFHLTFAPPPVYFMHLPKTGGTALGRWLRASYRRGYVDLRTEQMDRLTLAELEGFRCFHSWHLGRGLYDHIGRSDLPSVTMLRDPIERAASAVRHHQRIGLDHPERVSPAHLAQMRPWLMADLGACVLAGVADAPIQNAQTRVLGNRRTFAVLFRGVAQPDARTLLFASYPVLDYPWLDQQMQEDDADSFQRARVWLDQMAVVGLTERYAESVLLLADLLGIPVPTDLPRANANPQRTGAAMFYRDQLSPAVVARLEELNRYDLELYAYARELFEQQWARYQARPRRTYSIAAHLRHALRPVKAQLKRVSRRRPVRLEGQQ